MDLLKFARKFGPALALLAGTLTMTPGNAQEFKWRMATTAPEASANYTVYALKFVKYAEQLTGGRVKIQPFPSGVLAPPFGVHDAVMNGVADLGQTVPAYIVNTDPANIVLSGQPGGMAPEAYFHWLYYGGGKELWEEFRREEMGLQPLIAGLGTAEIFAHSHRPIREKADMVGLKFRTIGSWANILQGFGAAPVVVPGHEVYTMLERKAIDAAEWSTPSGNLKAGLEKIAKYIVVPGVHSPSYAFEVIMKKEKWDGLPPDIRQQLQLAAQLTSFDTYMEWGVADLDAMARLLDGRNEVVYLSDQFVQEIKQAGREWVSERVPAQQAKGNPWIKRISDSYFSFQDKWEATSRALGR
ncbi:TRAP transporter substrate-binding protein DctP [Bordetella petrii]|uniref:TRAP transporter substrate-binding protein DctP n=1 Tax=Bordetella petrii TaxID=94624 RepID=UPI0004AEFA43|nr:TRAP transporter substrate-binding protein DctP [Bordetella petrii]